MHKPDDERGGLPSASAWRRFELCAGSYQLGLEAERLGQEAHKSSPDAVSGTRIHAKLAGQEVELSESEAQSAGFLRERADDQVQRIFGDITPERITEKRLWLELNGERALSGQFDRVSYTQSLALVQDFKTGWTEPDPAEQNAQMRVLAVLVALAKPTLEEVIVQIVSGPFGISEARYTMRELSVAYDDIVATLHRINTEDAAFNPSPEACKHCPAALICQALKNTIGLVAKVQLSQLPDGERAAKLLDEVELIQGHIDEIKAYYAGRLTEDPTYELPGWAMVPGASVREVTDWEKALAKLGGYVEKEALWGAAAYRIAELEKALAKAQNIKLKDAKTKFNEILNGLINFKENKPSLKRVKGQPMVASLEG
jgi:hypothetical protein